MGLDLTAQHTYRYVAMAGAGEIPWAGGPWGTEAGVVASSCLYSTGQVCTQRCQGRRHQYFESGVVLSCMCGRWGEWGGVMAGGNGVRVAWGSNRIGFGATV